MEKAQQMTDHINHLIDAEIAALDISERANRITLADFSRLRVKRPAEVTVNFSGGITQTCWTVTRPNGDYQVIYLPSADYFSLCVGSDFGPLDIGVHGPALKCFASV